MRLFIATLVSLALLQGAIFFAPLYALVLDPSSSTGAFENSVHQLKQWPADPAKDVLVLGDSRIYAALDPARAASASGRYRFLNAGVPGTTPRCWFYYARAIDPDANRFRALVIPVDAYSDDTSAIGSLDANNHANDLRYIIFQTQLPDAFDLAQSFEDSGLRDTVARDVLLRGPILRPDAQAFVANPAVRLQAIRSAAPDLYSPVKAHASERSLAGLIVDFRTNQIDFPAGLTEHERTELPKQVLRIAEPSPTYAAYRMRWLAPIVERYRRAGIPVVFVRIPARPIHRSDPEAPSGSIVSMAKTYGAIVIDQAPYVALEKPELFADRNHLNTRGSALFSTLLGRDVALALRTPERRYAAGAPTARASPVDLWGSFSTAMFGSWGGAIPLVSFQFILFVTIVCGLYFAMPRRYGPIFLTIASYYFYYRWNARFVFILGAITISDYAIALALERTANKSRFALLTAGVLVNVAFLGVFKYANFFTGSVASLFGMRGDPWALALIVPVGISFHTFQSISYLVDVYRRKLPAIRNLGDYALYIAFFPQLLSGPIVRATQFFGELTAWKRPSAEDTQKGVLGIAIGLAKKAVIADRFGGISDQYFSAPALQPGILPAWAAAFAFAMQIYFDFSGYTDIAIGCARLLGFAFPQNFNKPYFALSITQFWRRWNMTLSAWLRDYVYIPLGGNRNGTANTYRNLILTMLVAGLWHGANWTFVAWGGYHGFLLAIERRWNLGNDPASRGARTMRLIVTFILVLFGWILFRADSFAQAGAIFVALFAGPLGSIDLSGWPLVPLAIALAIGVFQVRGSSIVRWNALPGAARLAAYCILILALETQSFTGAAIPFVYFKF